MSDTALHAPSVADLAGQPLVVHYGDPDAEYASLRRGALIVDRSHRARWQFRGARARDTVAGLVTNDVAHLEAGHGCYAAALTPKGKIVADVRIFAFNDSLLVDVPARAAAGWREIVRKYVNPRSTPYLDVSQSMADVGVFGARAAHVIASTLGIAPDTLLSLPTYGHAEYTIDGTAVTVARVPDAGIEGFDLFVETSARASLSERLQRAGAACGGNAAFEVTRVEAGRPEWGLDIDDSTIPQEGNFDALNAISYTKGCYTGQETVARIHFRGHVNRSLRGLRLAPDGPIPPRQTPLTDVEGKPVGDVRSALRSPQLGLIALAMVRREVPVGATLAIRWDALDGQEAGETIATVVELPFDPGAR
jgi:folate-binding protein YgfZ